ncbi:sodium/calcium exchanger NCL2-like isoform X1 [Actinidia eriantha]|uniref:sodium/calcium exchanger NCL2-like isoform X1 n=1 Tax=Actinidia eriantha TaxID=165200 RepID=UPI00258C7811|nr:sodium/calcium exchanger NCL2-like isoform X1 [Actinidia eriantha]
MENLSRTAYHSFILFLLSARAVSGRPFQYSATDNLISDGIDRVQINQSSFLLLKGVDASEELCEQMYGFLPCSYTGPGHLFLIVVYEYLLFHGESYVASGGERVFKILGPGIFGASAFHVIGFLPESVILLASGLLNTKETAQEYVYTGVGLLAGSTILLLTLLWGTCVIVASTRNVSNNLKSIPSVDSSPGQNPFQRFFSFFTGYGITVDVETGYTARIMVLSVIPFLVIQIPTVFNFSSSLEHIVGIIALAISVLLLLVYFFYQMFEPWIQNRRLEYVKHEHLVVDILRHVHKHTLGRLLTEDGAPNVQAIKSIFEEVDEDGDKLVSLDELRKLLHEIKYKRWHADKDTAVAKVMEEFDIDSDEKINEDEFVNGFTRWIDDIKLTMDKQYHSVRSLKDLYMILQPWIQKRRKEYELKKQLMSEILGHVQSSAMGTLLTEDGKPDIPAIKRLFAETDRDNDNYISQSELRKLVVDIKFRNMPVDADEVVEKIMEELDINEDEMINEEEFIAGFSKWLKATNNNAPHSPESEDEIYQKKWKETDLLVEERSVDRSYWAWTKAIMLLVVGVAILGVLAEPLIDSVQNFSQSANIPSFFISFILVPLATNARGAISAITASSRKTPRTTSLTFSEIYGGVFMNNVLGFCVLLSLIYFRGLSWDFSAEVLVVLIVCVIMGVATSLSSAFPVWTSLVAFLLYPLSLILVYILDDYFQLS